MNVIRFLRSDPAANWHYIVFMSAVSGLAGGAILAVINVAAEVGGADAPEDAPKHQLLLMFLVAIAIYVFAKRLSVFRTTQIVERLVTNLRLRICDKLRHSELETVEGLDKSEVLTTITGDANLIAQSGFVLTNSGQQAVMLVVGALYLAWLSQAAFWLFVAGAALGAWFFLGHRKALVEAFGQEAKKQAELFSYLNQLLVGYKELRLSEKKNDEIYSAMSEVADQSRQLRQQANMVYLTSSLFNDITLYLLLGAIIFILPQIMPTYSDVLVKSTMAIMFIFSPLAGVVATLPQLASADVALENLYRLERGLDVAQKDAPADGADDLPLLADFQTIALDNVVYSYANRSGSDGFTVGPVNLEIRRGEILFIVGGNGSGKTTLLKLIAGLYRPHSGEIRVDRMPLTPRLLPAYRCLFAGVFSDFHLFDRLYGIGQLDVARAQELLAQVEMADKVRIVGGRFSTLNLSTGQRKRLALVASLLEDRAVYIFDEWTADQDPHFRERFYGEILPRLKANGKTVITITHDDRYWGAADRVIKLDYGRIVAVP